MLDRYETLNDESVMNETPIGRLRVVEYGDRVVVVAMNRHAPERIARILHFLEAGQNPLAAIYGKRHWETPAAVKLFRRRDDLADADKDRQNKNLGMDFQAALRSYVAKHNADGKEAIATLGVK